MLCTLGGAVVLIGSLLSVFFHMQKNGLINNAKIGFDTWNFSSPTFWKNGRTPANLRFLFFS